jgi:hypothetical protein
MDVALYWKIIEYLALALASVSLTIVAIYRKKVDLLEVKATTNSDNAILLNRRVSDLEGIITECKGKLFCPMHNTNMTTMETMNSIQKDLVEEMGRLRNVLITVARVGVFHNHDEAGKALPLKNLFDEDRK